MTLYPYTWSRVIVLPVRGNTKALTTRNKHETHRTSRTTRIMHATRAMNPMIMLIVEDTPTCIVWSSRSTIITTQRNAMDHKTVYHVD